VKYDNRTTQKPGFKFAEWELKELELRLDQRFRKRNFEVARRDTLTKEVKSKDGIATYISDLLRKFRQICLIKH
jgi:prolyl-tRNA synthetase